ncbi:MAG: EAL domain-containing protein [Proteobacteria bacterium]|nr:EAL domain-containing protein [Pseudomonadota bacterium]
MNFRQILLVSLLAAAAAGLSVLAFRYDQLWVAVAAMSGVFAGGGLLLHFKGNLLLGEVEILREHLEGTRQHAALLARHTRELREAFVYTSNNSAIRPDEFATLSALVRDLADGVSELDRRIEMTEGELADLRRVRVPAPARPAQPEHGNVWKAPARPVARTMSPLDDDLPITVREPVRPARVEEPLLREEPLPPRQQPQQNEPPRAVRQLVAAAIAADRFDLFLQRIVSLPQRKIRAYEVTLRPDGSDMTIPNSDIRLAVEAVGHQLAFDRKLMIQAVRLARVFEQRDRDVLLFADISQRFLMSEAAFDDLDALLADVPQATQRIVLCLPQRFFKKAVAFEHEALRNLAKMGFSFLMRDVEDFDFEPHKLAQMGVRWVRMNAGIFLTQAQENDTLLDVATPDVIALMSRRRLGFIADTVVDEKQVAELIDLGVEYAQGGVFALPQAVRADVLEPIQPEARQAPEMAQAHEERRGLRDLARRA